MLSLPSPPRSWRIALVVTCLVATTIVCAILAGAVRQANAALEAATSQTLRDYATTAGRMLGSEAIQRSREFRAKLFGPLMGTVVVKGSAPELATFASRADSLYRAEKYASDSLRGYMRIDARTGHFEGLGAMQDSAFARLIADTIFERARTTSPAAMILTVGGHVPLLVAGAAVSDALGRRYIYVVTQTRATNFRHAMSETMETVPLLPPSFTGATWNMDQPVSAVNRQRNYAMIGVRIIAADGALLYASPRWFGGRYSGSYTLQSGPGSFTIHTVLRPDLESRLMPRVVRTAGTSLYIGLVLVGCFLLAVSLIAFRGEMSYQRSERARSMQQLTTGLRHELNNALASVMLEAQMLSASEEASTDSRYAGAAIAEQAERMRKVIRRLDNVDVLPVVKYFEGKSMVDLAEGRVSTDAARAS